MSYHFDLASPSASIPLSFFPTPPVSYGYNDFGAWLAEFEVVSCENWAGYNVTNVGPIDEDSFEYLSAFAAADPEVPSLQSLIPRLAEMQVVVPWRQG